MNKFEEWIKKNRNYDVTIEEYVSTAGVTNLYIDDKFLLTRNDNLQSIMYGATSTELCLAFPTDKEIGFKNPIEEFLENFFIYGFHFIENSKKMYQTELLGVTAFKIRKDNKPELRFWPPIQGMGDDLYYYDLHSTGYVDYQQQMKYDFEGIELHPTYEGKVMTYLRDKLPHLANENTLFWIVGSKPYLTEMEYFRRELGNFPVEPNVIKNEWEEKSDNGQIRFA